jgi:hypothetical protein
MLLDEPMQMPPKHRDNSQHKMNEYLNAIENYMLRILLECVHPHKDDRHLHLNPRRYISVMKHNILAVGHVLVTPHRITGVHLQLSPLNLNPSVE